MKIFSVGGSIRDELLGLPVHDLDYCVVGATEKEMTDLGYVKSGKDFPVFRDSKGDEFALARKEKKNGKGYYGFECQFDPSVTIEEDLLRRDLTINAMAKDQAGNIIDPYGGQDDLKNRVIRHVSDAFKEDPVRILRVARFNCRYHEQGFSVAKETMELMKDMVESGELDHVTPERILAELEKACTEKSPSVFFETLRECGALKVIIPELDALHGVPQPVEHHPEVDSFVHTMMAVDAARRMTEDKEIIISALLHDLGKGLTEKSKWPKHHSHEKNGVPLVKSVCERYKMTKRTKKLAMLACEFHLKGHLMMQMTPNVILDTFERMDGIRNPKTVSDFMTVCKSDAIGRKGFENKPYPQIEFVESILPSVLKVDSSELLEKGYKGQELAYQIRCKRLDQLKLAIHEYKLNIEENNSLSM